MSSSFHLATAIAQSLTDAAALEQLYRAHKPKFAQAFQEAAGDKNSELIAFWNIRLKTDQSPAGTTFAGRDVWFLVLVAVVTGGILRVPEWFGWFDPEVFYPRNLAILLFGAWALFVHQQNQIPTWKPLAAIGSTLAILALYTNMLPNTESDSIILALVHVPLCLWCVVGITYMQYDYRNIDKRIQYVRFNGEWIILTGLIGIAGVVMTAITLKLFSAIDIHIEELYLENIGIFGAVAAPMIAFYLIRLYPTLTQKIAPIIARVFTPLVVVTLAVYLPVLIASNDKILKDRELLLLFNVMLVAVTALIVFAVSGLNAAKGKHIQVMLLFMLALLALCINVIALTAIVSRAFQGLTPNRTVVLISNLLIFTNLIVMARDLYRNYFHQKALRKVEETVARYLAVYAVWALVVVVLWPVLFGFR